jgi:hypothetical protein
LPNLARNAKNIDLISTIALRLSALLHALLTTNLQQIALEYLCIYRCRDIFFSNKKIDPFVQWALFIKKTL